MADTTALTFAGLWDQDWMNLPGGRDWAANAVLLTGDPLQSVGPSIEMMSQWASPALPGWESILLNQYVLNATAPLATDATQARRWIDIESANVTRILTNRPKEIAPAVEVIAEWDGYVEEIHKDYFVARMRGVRGKGVEGSDEEAEIPLADVDTADMDLVALGGFFCLVITDEKPKVGPKRRYTSVQFRRLPAYTKRDLAAAEREADEIIDGFRLAPSSQASGG